MANDQFKYVPQQLFACSVPISNAKQYYVVDGLLTNGDDLVKNTKPHYEDISSIERSFKVHSRMETINVGLPMPDEESSNAVEVVLPAGKVQKELFQIISIRNNASEIKYDLNVRAEKGSCATVILCCHTLMDKRCSTVECINIKVEEGASLTLLALQNENELAARDTHVSILLEKGATLNMNNITLHEGCVTNNITAVLGGEEAECNLNGLYLADGEKVVNTQINILHAVPNCRSNQLFKGILGGNSKSDFGGEIIVATDAQGTEAYQANNNLLVSDGARALSQPHLVIYADDVKCSHGSTIGTVGDEEMFYMRSRGISEAEARVLQQQAFAGTVLEKISNPELRERLSSLVERRLRGEFTKCGSCSKHRC
ncbi:MAG: Fe-S cluster assembly protein SufD [Candidatus Egerieousia sp.]